MDKVLRFIPLGGVGDVTRNMYVYEYEGDILLVDCGIGFPDQEMFGVDLLIPDITYLLDKIDRIKGILLTHGHEDHIGALPYILPSLLAPGQNAPRFPIYATKLTAGLANAKLVEFGLGTPIKTANYNQPITLGSFTATFVHITHSIPDSANIAITSPAGTFFHASDFKFDPTPMDNKPSDLTAIAQFGKNGVIGLFSDCLRSEQKGSTPSEKPIEQAFVRELEKTAGKCIVTTYSSSIARIQQVINAAVQFNRKVCFVGRSMVQTKDVAVRLGFLRIPQGIEVTVEQIKHYEDKQLVLLIAGSQGQENSAMSRIANNNDKFVKIEEDDTVIFSSDPIPGNENAVNALIDVLSKSDANIVYSDISDEFHVSGHGSADDVMQMMELTKPRFLLPIGGTYKHMVQYRKLAMQKGWKKQDVFLVEDGDIVSFTKNAAKVVGRVPLRNIYVDDIEGTEVQSSVIRDRQKLAEDGILTVIVQMDKDGKIYDDIDIVSRGIIDFTRDKGFLTSLKQEVRRSVMSQKGQIRDWHLQRKLLETTLEKFIFKKSRRRPLVLPLIVEV